MSLRTSTLAVLTLLLCGLSPAQSVAGSISGSGDGDRSGSALATGAYGAAADAIAIGSPNHDPGAAADSGRVFVRSAAGASLLDLAGAAGDEFGASLALGGDLDDDGVPDLVVGAPGTDDGLGADQGTVLVISGATGLTLVTASGLAAGDRFGTAVAIIADINSDMMDDFVVGAPAHDTGGMDAGRVTIHSGATGAVLFTADGSFADAAFGTTVAAAGDVDGDGVADALAGEPLADAGGLDMAGRVRVISGFDGSDLRSFDGAAIGDRLGAAVASAGDQNEDGTPDILVGVPGFDGVAGSDTGAVLVYTGSILGTVLLTVEGSAAGEFLGEAVAGGTDLDRDGVTDIVAGAPSFDGVAGADSGRVVVINGRDGSTLFALEGSAAGDLEGTAVAAGGQFSDDLQPDLASGAPAAAEGGTDRGRTQILELDSTAAARVDVYDVEAGPTQIARADVDADGDLDLVTVSGSFVSVLWNGDQSGTLNVADLATTARTDIALSSMANAVSVAVGQWDSDDALEIVVGRDDGTVDLIDGTGTGATTAFSLTVTSPFTVDSSAPASAISSVAVIGTGISAELVCAAQGSIAVPGFITRIQTPLGVPTLAGPLVSGGVFEDIAIGDIDGDLVDDIIAVNSSTGSSGGLHVLNGPAYGAATGSPFALPAPSLTCTLLDLDGDDIDDDAAVTSVSFSSGGVRVLVDYVDGVGFTSTVDPGLTFALDASAGDLDGVLGDDLAVLDGVGALSTLTGWNGSAFATTTSIPIAEAAGVAVLTVELTSALSPEDWDEIAVVHLATDRVSLWHRYVPSTVSAIASSGCPSGGPISTIELTTSTVLGTLLTDVRLVGASPFAPAFLAAQRNATPGASPMVTAVSGCGIAMTAGEIFQYFTFTDINGDANLPGGIPNDPALIGREFVLQWGVLDGGSILGNITASDAVLVRFGEI